MQPVCVHQSAAVGGREERSSPFAVLFPLGKAAAAVPRSLRDPEPRGERGGLAEGLTLPLLLRAACGSALPSAFPAFAPPR